MKHFLLITFLFLGFALTGLAQNNPARADFSGGNGVRTGSLQTPENGKETLKLFIPNAFTPNDDGINDIYYIQNSNFKKFEFAVFDRWGNQMFSTNNPEFRWDGKINGKAVASGIYVFVFNGLTNDEMTIKRSGTITIVR